MNFVLCGHSHGVHTLQAAGNVVLAPPPHDALHLDDTPEVEAENGQTFCHK